jgi:threonine dehydrogenase-like Zn-dependent dehydrogenase
VQEPIKFPATTSHKDKSTMMTAVEWHGKGDVRVVQRPKPMITEPKDCIVRVTSTTICGSDLHLYHEEFSGMYTGDILGHECMGIVESVGSEVSELKVGDRVVVSCVIAEGSCFYCQNGAFSCCDCTNPSKEMEKLYGHRTSGFFGYSHLTGGYEGCQAEFVRVPFADINCLKVPNSLPDEKVLFLSDIVCTGYHATELGLVSKGHTVAVWGCGPVGLMAVAWCIFKGAKRVIAIDGVDYRLRIAKEKLGVETIDFTKQDVVKTLQEMAPGGPDVCIDAVGFRLPKSLLHKFQRAVKLETDTSDVLYEAITAVRKAGTVSVVGDYYALTNNYPIGAFMEKGLTMRGGQVFAQKYWKQLLQWIEQGLFDPTFVITHSMPLENAATAYKMFDQHSDGMVKVILKTKNYPLAK